MVVMALDHVRDFFSNALAVNLRNPDEVTAPLFLTRWVTHFCAPTFVLLAGVGAALTARRLSKPQLARFLITRGLWLVLLELTLVRLGFYFTFDFHDLSGLVIWALGWCMVLLGVIQFLPTPAILAFALILICGHNAMDTWKPAEYGFPSWLWGVLHGDGHIVLGSQNNYIIETPYKIIPWVGVMAYGFWLGPLFQLPQVIRRQFFFRLGVITVLAYFALRAMNGYGDPVPWWEPVKIRSWTASAISFFNCVKYPPSLCYLLMTLGPAFLLLAAFDREPGWLGRRIVVLGRVPLFYYLLHLPLIHGLAVLCSYVQNDGLVDAWLISPPALTTAPPDYGYSLPIVYAVWIAVVVILYTPCAWFAEQKRKHPGGWRSYF